MDSKNHGVQVTAEALDVTKSNQEMLRVGRKVGSGCN
jgi:hypothetical protein